MGNHVISILFVFNLFNNPYTCMSILCSNCKQNVQILHILLIILLRLAGENMIPFDLFCMFGFSHTPYIKFSKCPVNDYQFGKETDNLTFK